jgi:Ca-activated chloride channel family protein
MLLFVVLSCAVDTPLTATPAPKAVPTVILKIDYGSEKKSWMEEMIRRFEEAQSALPSGERIEIEAQASGSGEATEAILKGLSQPHVFSPASGAYLSLLNEDWQKTHPQALTGAGEPLVLSPVVIAMWEPMARSLGWPDKKLGWTELLQISANPQGWGAYQHPEWGKFKLGHTHPRLSNSGLLSVLAESYAGAGKTRGLVPEDLQKPEVLAYLEKIEGTLVHYGKSTSFFADKMKERGPGYISAAVLYENLVVESRQSNTSPALVAIYPMEGTFWSDHPYAILNGIPEKEKAAAQAFLDFLKARPQQEAALQYGFRPADPAVAIGAPISLANGVDPTQPQTLLEIPTAPTLQAVLAAWDQTKKTSEVTLVFDKSGSMRGEPLASAKKGAISFLRSLSDRDSVALQFFDSTVLPGGNFFQLKEGRDQLESSVNNAIASGGTALYDAVRDAYKVAAARAKRTPNQIHAVLVMTDGRDEDSSSTLDAVKSAFAGSGEEEVRVFTIAYGKGADPTILREIAEAGGGASAAGDPASIDSLFRDMAAFF